MFHIKIRNPCFPVYFFMSNHKTETLELRRTTEIFDLGFKIQIALTLYIISSTLLLEVLDIRCLYGVEGTF